MSPQLQTTPSALSGLQLASATAIMSPQPQSTPFTFNSQPTMANPSALIGPTATGSPQLQTTPSALGGLQLESTLHGPAMLQSQPPRPDTPMTQFLKLTSSFDFSDINFNSNPSLDSQPAFGMDQHWNMACSRLQFLGHFGLIFDFIFKNEQKNGHFYCIFKLRSNA